MRKQWKAWSAVIVVATLGATAFWTKNDRTRLKLAPVPSPATEAPPEAADSQRELPPRREGEASSVARPKAPSPEPVASTAAPGADDSVAEQTDVEKAQVARLPVIYAIRGNYPNDQARFEAMRHALQESGPSTEAWTGSAHSVFQSWDLALDGVERQTESGGLRCYVAGCEMLVTFPDRASFEQGSQRFRGIEDQLPLGRVQTPGISLPDGRVQVSWMLMRPDTPPPTAG